MPSVRKKSGASWTAFFVAWTKSPRCAKRTAWWWTAKAGIAAEFEAGARPQRQRQSAQQRRHRRHQNRTEAQHARFKNRIVGVLSLIALCLKREIDHHDRVFFHDSDQEHNANDGDDIQILLKQHQRKHRAYARRRYR